MANKSFIPLALCLLPLWVHAQAPAAQGTPLPAPQPVPTATPAAPPASPAATDLRVENVVIGKDEFTRMQRDILLLKKRLEETDLRAQITAKMKDIERLNAPVAVPEVSVVFKSMRQTVDGERAAQFVMSDGSSITAREGDTLPNGMRVASIRSDAVVLRKGSVERRVGVGGSTSRGTAPGTPGGSSMGSMGRPF